VFIAIVARTPDLVEQLLAAINTSGVTCKMPQQFELPGGQFQGFTMKRGTVPIPVHPQFTTRQPLNGLLAGGIAERIHTAKYRTHPRDQLADGKGFGQVVIGAHLQAQHSVELTGPGCQHQDGDIGTMFAQPATDFQTVQSGEHQIENHQVVGATARAFQPGCTAVFDIGFGFAIAQMQPYEFRDIVIILDDQNAAWHAVPPRCQRLS
jgi:hypothetical protein